MKPLPTLATILVSTTLVACTFPQKEGSPSSSESAEVGAPAPASVELACVKAAEDWWHLGESTAVPVSSQFLGSGLYEVHIRAGKRRFSCRVNEDGSIRSVQGAGKRR
jgi:hypothetical protein